MKKLTIILSVLFFLSSCELFTIDDDMNLDPNQPNTASAPQLLANAMRYLPGLSSNPDANFYGQYLAETQYAVQSRYPDESWSFYYYYQNPLINTQIVLNNSSVDNELAVAKILKAYFFWHVTDRWGDVPYSEALQGEKNLVPAYDRQEDIYNSLFKLLDEADEQINESLSLSNDQVFGGDMTKWKRTANTIHLLMALRLSEVNPEKGRTEFNKALENGIMLSNDDNFTYHPLADQNNENYWYNQIDRASREWWALTESFVDLLAPLDDPRLPVYADPARQSGDYIGQPLGYDPAPENAELFSLLGEQQHQQDSPVPLVTYAQALFAKAEAVELGWITEDAGDNYNKAVEASILQWTGSDDTVEDYLNQPDVAYDGTIEQIATQRYIHLFLHGYEAWAEWRRTGFPAFVVPIKGNPVPTRQRYSEDEAANNTDNYQEAVDRQFGGENTMYGKVWWDVD